MSTYWVITVTDLGDRGAGLLGYEHRFEFGDTEDAFRCAKSAQDAGFKVSAARVLATRERLSSTAPR
jgi:hypothetical protein